MTSKLSSSKQVQKIRKAIRKAEIVPEVETIIAPTEQKNNKVTIILEGAVLQVGQMKSSGNVLLNFENHSKHITKYLNRNPEDFRPDILHQSVLTLVDSTLNKAGCLRILIHTEDKRLIEINAATKVPRTYKRFAGMFAKLLQTGAIKTETETLLEVLSGSPIDHIASTDLIIGTSSKAKLVDLPEFIKDKSDLVFVVGCVAKGSPALDCGYTKENICISRYQLSTSNCLSKITDALERKFGIL